MVKEKSIDGLIIRHDGDDTAEKKVEVAEKVKKIEKVEKAEKVEKPVKKIEVQETEPAEETTEKTEVSAAEEFLKPVEAFDLNLESKDVQKSTKREKKQKKKPGKVRKVLSVIALVIVLGIIGGLIWLMVYGNDIIVKLTGGSSNIWDAIGTLTSETYEPLKVGKNGRTNILIFGTSGYDMEGSVGKQHYAGSQLTDSIMLLSLDQDTGDIAMVNIPRDLRAVKTCTATGKINEVYYCNSMKSTDEAGAKALMSAITTVTGVDIQYYAHVNWMSLVRIVNAVDGITITLDYDITDYSYTKTVIKANVPTKLNGLQALALARARHGTVGGDFTRGDSQQKILIALKDRILEKGIDFNTALGLLDVLNKNYLTTNFSLEDIKTGVHIAQTFEFDSMRQVPLVDYDNNKYYVKTANINGISYVIPSAGDGNFSEIKKYVAKMFDKNPAVREDAKILVLNGTNESGVAAKEKTKLTELGYNIAGTDNAPAGEYTETYYLYSLSKNKNGTKQALEDLYGVESLSKEQLPAGINANKYDFVIIIGKVVE